MRRLNKNYWRLGWVLTVNIAVLVLQLTGPIRAYHDQQVISESLRTPPPSFSYWKGLVMDPWVPVLALILLTGIVTEIRRNVLSPILNLAPFVMWMILALRDPFYSRQGLIIFPLVTIIAIDLIFYSFAFRVQGSVVM